MSLYEFLKLLHLIGASVLLGTGAGIAFFMLMAHRTRNVTVIAHTAHIVVLADYLFTASAVVLQPVTGMLLAHIAGYPLSSPWIAWSMALYLVTGAFWLPVVWMQTRMRDLAMEAAANDETLPAAYHRLWRLWFAFGFPAFGAVLTIIWLMTAKPGG